MGWPLEEVYRFPSLKVRKRQAITVTLRDNGLARLAENEIKKYNNNVCEMDWKVQLFWGPRLADLNDSERYALVIKGGVGGGYKVVDGRTVMVGHMGWSNSFYIRGQAFYINCSARVRDT